MAHFEPADDLREVGFGFVEWILLVQGFSQSDALLY